MNKHRRLSIISILFLIILSLAVVDCKSNMAAQKPLTSQPPVIEETADKSKPQNEVDLPGCREAVMQLSECSSILDPHHMAQCFISRYTDASRECPEGLQEAMDQTQNIDRPNPLSDKPISKAMLIAWNNIFPYDEESAQWYDEDVGFNGAYVSNGLAVRKLGDHLRFGVRVSYKWKKVTDELAAAGGEYFASDSLKFANFYHPEVLASIMIAVDDLFGGLPEEVKDNIGYILMDSEGGISPPNTSITAPGQQEAIALISAAARQIGVINTDEDFPAIRNGMVLAEDLANEKGEIRTDTIDYRIMDWWYRQGGGAGLLWHAVKARIRLYLPDVYFTTDPIAGVAARTPVPVHGAKNAGLDFVQNWFTISGTDQRLPIYSAVMLKIAKTSGLPVVQGPHMFWAPESTTAYPGQMIHSANLLTLCFNARNGSTAQNIPWGVLHWGFKALTDGATVEMLRQGYGDVAEILVANRQQYQDELFPALHGTRDFMEENTELLSQMEDIPARIGILLTRSAQYATMGYDWWTYYHRITAYAYPLLMSQIPFEFVSEDDDLSRFDVLVIPDSSFITDEMVARLNNFNGKVTGTSVPEKIRENIPGWIDSLPRSEVGNFPWGAQNGYPLGGHMNEIPSEQMIAWMDDRAVKFKTFFSNLTSPPEIDAGTDVITNIVKWNDKRVLFVVNNKLAVSEDNPKKVDQVKANTTKVYLKGHWQGGTYLPERQATAFWIKFDGPGAKTIVLEPYSEPEQPGPDSLNP